MEFKVSWYNELRGRCGFGAEAFGWGGCFDETGRGIIGRGCRVKAIAHELLRQVEPTRGRDVRGRGPGTWP